MKFTTLFTTLTLALPAVLGAVLVSTNTTQSTEVAQTSGYDSSEISAAVESRDLDIRGKADIAKSIAELINSILKRVQADNEGRGEFTRKTVTEGRAKWPQYNWVICHTDHRQYFDGKQGENWGHYHREYDIDIGGTIGYEIYWFESGRFERRGDGGWLNWAYIGNVVRTENGGKTVIFS